jgi:hypothetical protein
VLIHLTADLAVWALGFPAQHWRARAGLEQWAAHLVSGMELRVRTHHSHAHGNSGEIGGKLLSGT